MCRLKSSSSAAKSADDSCDRAILRRSIPSSKVGCTKHSALSTQHGLGHSVIRSPLPSDSDPAMVTSTGSPRWFTE